MKVIKFRRLNRKPEFRWIKYTRYTIFGTIEKFREKVKVQIWEIAFDEKHLYEKLNGEMAEVIMPGKAWYIQAWRKLFPLKGVKGTAWTKGKIEREIDIEEKSGA